MWSEKNNKPWYHPSASPGSLYSLPFVAISNSEPYLSIVLFIKKTQSSHSSQIVPSYKADHSWYVFEGFSHSSTYTLLMRPYLCDFRTLPRNWLTTGFLFVWFPLTSLTNIAVISLDQLHAKIRPIQPFKASPH